MAASRRNAPKSNETFKPVGQSSIRRELIVVAAGQVFSGIGVGVGAESGVVVKPDVLGMTIHKTDIVDGIVIRDVFVASQAFVPGITPVNWPFGHEEGSRRMFYCGELHVQEMVGIPAIITAIEYVARIIESTVLPMGDEVLRA